MEPSKKRRSDRISVQLPIIISGTDVMGKDFVEAARTVLIARYGAKILCQRKLSPQLEIVIHCLMTSEDAHCRVVGQVREGSEGIYYGVEIADQDVDLWGVEFPPIELSESAIGRVLVECAPCRRRELAYLNEFEAEVLERSRSLWRFCKRCGETSLWKETWLRADEDLPKEEETQTPKVASPPKRSSDDRKHTRIDLHMEALIRDPQGWEEVVISENVSRGGLRFRSKKHYAEDWTIEVALPYSRSGANIFSAAQIKHIGKGEEEGQNIYGVAYTPWQDAWVDRWVPPQR
ncbi:MAG: PilZ domain-containing protein [Terriglobia bacterium]